MGLWSILRSLFSSKSASPSCESQTAATLSATNEQEELLPAPEQDSVPLEVERTESEQGPVIDGEESVEQDSVHQEIECSLPIPSEPSAQAQDSSTEERQRSEDIEETIIDEGKIKELREDGSFVEHDLSPFSFATYVGQEMLKNDLRKRIERVKQDPEQQFPHLLLSGPPEMGKRTLAFALAHEMGVNIISCNPPLLQRFNNLALVLTQLEERDFLLIEAIELPSKALLSQLLKAIEDRAFDLVVGQGSSRRSVTLALRSFTLVGTTSQPTQVDRALRRWLLVKDFAPYSVDQMSELVMVLAAQQGLLILPDAAELLAGYCDGSVGNTRVLVKRIQAYKRGSVCQVVEKSKAVPSAVHQNE